MRNKLWMCMLSGILIIGIFGCGGEDTSKEFMDLIENQKYEEAYDMLYFTNHVDGDFTEFAQENLVGCETKRTEEGFDIIGADETYHLLWDEKEEKYNADDFTMECPILYSSYINLPNNSFSQSPSEKLDNGLTKYHYLTFKDEEVKIYYDIVMGMEDQLVPQFTLTAKMNDDYQVERIVSVEDSFRKDEDFSNWVRLEDDKSILINKYYINEAFAQTIATTYSGMIADMYTYATAGMSFDDFYKNIEEPYIWDSDFLRSSYNDVYNLRGKLNQYYDSYDCRSKSWTYPEEFWYSQEEYILQDTVLVNSFKNGDVKNTQSDTAYVLFAPGRNRFKVYSSGYDKVNLDSPRRADRTDNEAEETQFNYDLRDDINYQEISDKFAGSYVPADGDEDAFNIHEYDVERARISQEEKVPYSFMDQYRADWWEYSEIISYDGTTVRVQHDGYPDIAELTYVDENTVLYRGEEFIRYLEDNSQSIVDIDVESEVKQIRDYYYTTQNNLGSYTIEEQPGMTMYYEQGFPIKIVVQAGHNDWDYTREYYYHDQQLYFAFIYKKGEEHRLYFKDNTLIRYIDSDKNTYDYGNLDEFYDLENKVISESDNIYETVVS